VRVRVMADWFPNLPELHTDGLLLKQYKLDMFSQEEINRVKDQFLDSNRIPVDWDGEIQKGDIVRVVWNWKMGDGQEWLSDKNDDSATLVKVGVNPRLEPGLEEKLIGSKKGSVIEHVIKVPANINEGSVNPQFSQHIKDIVKLAGKSVYLRLEVIDVQRPQKPELDEKLLKKYNLESETALEERIIGNLKEYVAAQNTEIALAQILDYLRKSDVLVPERYIQNYSNYLLSKFANLLNLRPGQNGYEFGSEEFRKELMGAISIEFPDWNYKSFQEFAAKVQQVSKEVMAGDFMINQVIKLVNLSDEELQRATLQSWLSLGEAQRKSMTEGQVREYFKNARHRTALNKLTDLLREKGQLQETETSSLKEFEELVTSSSDDALHSRYFATASN